MSSCYILNKIISAYTHTHVRARAFVLYVVIHGKETPVRLCKSMHGAATTSIFRLENKLLDASCRSSCRSTTRKKREKLHETEPG